MDARARRVRVVVLLIAGIVLGGAVAKPLEAPIWSAAVYLEAEKAVALRWWPVAAATEYRVLRNERRKGEPKEIGRVAVPFFLDKGADRGKNYEYTLQAYEGSVAGPLSSRRCISVGAAEGGECIDAPQWEGGTYREIAEMGALRAEIELTWKAMPEAVGYHLYRREGEVAPLLLAAVSGVTFKDTSVTGGRIYYYAVKAVDATHGEGPASAEWGIAVQRTVQTMGQSVVTPAPGAAGGARAASAPPSAPAPSATAADARSLAAGVDELWVIQKPAAGATAPGAAAAAPVVTEVSPAPRPVAMAKKAKKLKDPIPRETTELWRVHNVIAGKGGTIVLNEGYDVEIDEPRGLVYVSSSGDGYVLQLSAVDGALVRYIGRKGKGNGEFDYLLGIGIGPDGKIYAAEATRNEIHVFNPDGTFVRKWAVTPDRALTPSAPAELRDVAVGKDGTVYALERGNGQIVAYDSTGRELQRYLKLGSDAGQIKFPLYLSLTRDGDFAVSNSFVSRVDVITKDGKLVRTGGKRSGDVEGFLFLTGFTFDTTDNVLITDKGAGLIKGFDKTGRYQFTLANREKNGPLPLNAPKGMACDSRDNCYVVEGMIGEVTAFHLGPYTPHVSEDESWPPPSVSLPQVSPPPAPRVVRLTPPAVPRPREEEYLPGCGELRAVFAGEKRTIPLPLEHTDAVAEIVGSLSTVSVTHRYHNPYSSKIEAVYVFPLPQNGAVTDFIMTIGERRIRGVVREREEAEKIYLEARRQGYTASLLTQERPNIFTQRVANIEPGKTIEVTTTYLDTLTWADGEYTFVLPTVVGPRFNPPGFADGVGAVGRGLQGLSGQATEVQYLRPKERSGHDIMITVDLEAGMPIEELSSPSHAINVDRKGRTAARVALKPSDTLPNKDFVLRYRLAAKSMKSALMVERDERGGYFALMLVPPANLADIPRTAQEMVFVVDTSGSMSGWPIEKAKAAMFRALKNLNADDTFQIVRFANDASTFAPLPVPATVENIASGIAFVERLSGGGGTMMIEGLKRALDFPHDEQRLRVVTFMTDGFIGNEDQILAAVAEKLGPSRIFSFGVGTSVNRYLLDGLARLGQGTVAYITAGDSDTEAVDHFYERVRHPAFTDITVEWGGMDVVESYPSAIPDLFIGRPLFVAGRFRGRGETIVRLTGRTGGEKQTVAIGVDLDDPASRRGGIAKVWARARIADLTDRLIAGGPQGLAAEIRDTALAYGLVSAYTAFVAVDSSRVTEGTSGTTVVQPVPVPQGVRYETTVQER